MEPPLQPGKNQPGTARKAEILINRLRARPLLSGAAWKMHESFSHHAHQITKWQRFRGAAAMVGTSRTDWKGRKQWRRRSLLRQKVCNWGRISAWTAAQACALIPFLSHLYLQPNAYDAALSQASSCICSSVCGDTVNKPELAAFAAPVAN